MIGPAEHCAALSEQHPGWRFLVIPSASIRPAGEPGGFLAVRRDDRRVRLFAWDLAELEAKAANWRPG